VCWLKNQQWFWDNLNILSRTWIWKYCDPADQNPNGFDKLLIRAKLVRIHNTVLKSSEMFSKIGNFPLIKTIEIILYQKVVFSMIPVYRVPNIWNLRNWMTLGEKWYVSDGRCVPQNWTVTRTAFHPFLYPWIRAFKILPNHTKRLKKCFDSTTEGSHLVHITDLVFFYGKVWTQHSDPVHMEAQTLSKIWMWFGYT